MRHVPYPWHQWLLPLPHMSRTKWRASARSLCISGPERGRRTGNIYHETEARPEEKIPETVVAPRCSGAHAHFLTILSLANCRGFFTQNIFWKLAHCDPHKALSFDRLHAYHLGLFGKHLWLEFKLVVDGLERKYAVIIDDQ